MVFKKKNFPKGKQRVVLCVISGDVSNIQWDQTDFIAYTLISSSFLNTSSLEEPDAASQSADPSCQWEPARETWFLFVVLSSAAMMLTQFLSKNWAAEFNDEHLRLKHEQHCAWIASPFDYDLKEFFKQTCVKKPVLGFFLYVARSFKLLVHSRGPFVSLYLFVLKRSRGKCTWRRQQEKENFWNVSHNMLWHLSCHCK